MEDELSVKSTKLGPVTVIVEYSVPPKKTWRTTSVKHIQLMTGMCSEKDYDKVLSDKNSLWRYFRHKHLKMFNFHCELCNHGQNEVATMKYHKDQTCGIPTGIRCENPGCNKPFP